MFKHIIEVVFIMDNFRSNIKTKMLILTCQQRNMRNLYWIDYGIMTLIHHFQKIESMSKRIFCEVIKRRRAGFFVPKLSFVREIVDGRLASNIFSDNARMPLLSMFDKFVKEIYGDNNYLNAREIFEKIKCRRLPVPGNRDSRNFDRRYCRQNCFRAWKENHWTPRYSK